MSEEFSKTAPFSHEKATSVEAFVFIDATKQVRSLRVLFCSMASGKRSQAVLFLSYRMPLGVVQAHS